MSAASTSAVHWLYPINDRNPGKVLFEGQRTYSRTSDGVRASFRAKPPHRWILSTGFRGIRTGDRLWIYSSGDEQCIVALTYAAADPCQTGNEWFVDLTPDRRVTGYLAHTPLPRTLFRQIPQSVARADDVTVAYLEAYLMTVDKYAP